MVDKENPKSICKGEDDTDDQCNPEFFEDDFENVPETYFIQRQTADNQCRTLGTTVSAGIHQHWNEGDKERDCGEGILVSCDDGACNGGGEHQDKEPHDTVLA